MVGYTFECLFQACGFHLMVFSKLIIVEKLLLAV